MKVDESHSKLNEPIPDEMGSTDSKEKMHPQAMEDAFNCKFNE